MHTIRELEAQEKYKNMLKRKNKEIKKLKRQIKIKDKWCRLIYDIGYDYDGFGEDIEGLKGVVDELVRYSVGALESDDKTAVYFGKEDGVEIKENILMERIENDKE